MRCYTICNMSLFNGQDNIHNSGIVVDIGGGSVGIAIVEDTEEETEIIWSHREYMLIKDDASAHAILKEMHTTLVNAFLELGSTGLKVARDHQPAIDIRHLQIAISAPWTQTITKHIQFEDLSGFTVTSEVLKSLVTTAQKEALAEQQKKNKDFIAIADVTIHVALNGYLIKKPIGKKCTSINLAQINILAQEAIMQTISELQNKILPKTKATYYSFMYVFYQTVRHLHPDTTEVCLIDITNETTEIGIVRDDTLSYTTYIPVGLYSLAREVALACSITKEEAYTFLKNSTDDIAGTYGEKNKEQVEAIFTAYQDAIATLFSNTGDALSIPKMFFLHTSSATENFFSKHIKEGAKKTTKTAHTVHLFTSELLQDQALSQLEDTALATSVHFFTHKALYLGTEHEINTHKV